MDRDDFDVGESPDDMRREQIWASRLGRKRATRAKAIESAGLRTRVRRSVDEMGQRWKASKPERGAAGRVRQRLRDKIGLDRLVDFQGLTGKADASWIGPAISPAPPWRTPSAS